MELKYDKEKIKKLNEYICYINDKWTEYKEAYKNWNSSNNYPKSSKISNKQLEEHRKKVFEYATEISEVKKVIEDLLNTIKTNESNIKEEVQNKTNKITKCNIQPTFKVESVDKNISTKQAFNWDRLDDKNGLSEKEYNGVIQALIECGIPYEDIQGKKLKELENILSTGGKGQYIEKLEKYYDYIIQIQKVKKDRKNEAKAEEIGNNTKVQELYDELSDKKAEGQQFTNKEIIGKAKRVILEKAKGVITEEKLNNLTVNELIDLLMQYGEYYLAGQVNDILIRAAIHGKGTTTIKLDYGESVEDLILQYGVNPYDVNGNEITINKNRKPDTKDIKALKTMNIEKLKEMFSSNYGKYYDEKKIANIEEKLKELYKDKDFTKENVYDLYKKLKENGCGEEANYLIGMYYVLNLNSLEYNSEKGEFELLPSDVEKRYTAQDGKGRTYSLFDQEMEGYEELQNLWNGSGICVPSSVASLISGFGINISQKDAIENLRKLAELYAEKYGDNTNFKMAYQGNKFLGLCSYGLHVEGYDIQDCTDRQKHVDNIWEHLTNGYPVAVSKHGYHPVELDDGTIIQNPTNNHAIAFIDYRIKADGTKQVRISDSYNTYTENNDGWVDLEYFVNNHMDSYMLVDDKNEDSVFYFDGYNSNGEYVRDKITVPKGTKGEDVVEKLTYEKVKSHPNYGDDSGKIETYSEVAKVDDYDKTKTEDDASNDDKAKDEENNEEDNKNDDNKDDDINKEKIEKRIIEIEERLGEIEGRLGAIDSELTDLQSQKEIIEEQLMNYETNGADIQSAKEKEAQRISNAQAEIDAAQSELNAENKELSENKADLERRASTLAETKSALEQKQQERDASIKTNKELLQKCEEDITTAEANRDTLQAEYDKLLEDYSMAEDVEEMQRIYDEITAKFDELDKANEAIVQLSENKQELENKIADLTDSLSDQEMQYENDLAEYKLYNEDYIRRKDNLDRAYSDLEADKAEEQRLQAEMKKLIEEMEKEMPNKEDLQNKLTEIEQKSNKLKEEQKALQSEQEALGKEKSELQK